MRFVIGCLVALFCVAACTGSAIPTPTSPNTISAASTSKSPTPTAPRTGPLTTGPNVRPGEKPPVLPRAATRHDSLGALAFAGYYVAALDWSAATNDTYLLEQVSSPLCAACQRNISAAKRLKDEHQVELGGRSRLISSRIVQGNFTIKSAEVVEVVTDDEAIVLVSARGQRATAAPSAHHQKSFVFISWSVGKWLVVGEGAPS